jgi:hypothetical protein
MISEKLVVYFEDIEDIELYLSNYFLFECYTFDDNLTTYSYQYSEDSEDHIEISIISNAKTIFESDKLHNILYDCEIMYLKWSVWKDNRMVKTFRYAPKA